MFLVLLGLKFLAFFILLGLQLVLLLLVFLIDFRVSRVGSGHLLGSWKIARMDWWAAGAAFRPACFCRSCFAALEFSGAGCSNDARPAVIGREALLRVRACGLDMRGLRGYRPDVPIARGGFFFTRCACVDSAVAVVADVGV